MKIKAKKPDFLLSGQFDPRHRRLCNKSNTDKRVSFPYTHAFIHVPIRLDTFDCISGIFPGFFFSFSFSLKSVLAWKVIYLSITSGSGLKH